MAVPHLWYSLSGIQRRARKRYLGTAVLLAPPVYIQDSVYWPMSYHFSRSMVPETWQTNIINMTHCK